jgi:hypothetical protein
MKITKPRFMTQYRMSYTGTIVCFHRTSEGWMPIDGQWVKRKMGKIEANVLCSYKDKAPPINYFDFNDPYFPIVNTQADIPR